MTVPLLSTQGGNTKTVLLVACSPHESCYSETLSTLKFAKRAKDIENIRTCTSCTRCVVQVSCCVAEVVIADGSPL